MNCKICKKAFTDDELDSDSLCFSCATAYDDAIVDSAKMLKELLEGVLEGLAKATQKSTSAIKDKLITEHYTDKAMKKSKKKKDAGNN
jgi:hypothetical protein